MKRRQRKPVLDVNGEAVDSSRRRWPNERQTQNGSPSNPLANLIGQYNSDSEAEDDNRPRARVLNDQVDHFFKEIQSISHEGSKNNKSSSMSNPGSYWQECYDEQTGYPYYWHTETNQVTWEMPPELKMLQETSQRETPAAHSTHIPQWSSVPPNKFSQSSSNIPEGMIPKEVVVRNRNRQAGIVNKPPKPESKADHTKSPRHKKYDTDDEGKIEMITSFGNDESESEESDHENVVKKPSNFKKTVSKSEHDIKVKSQNVDSKESKHQIGPAPPTMHYGPQNKEKLSDKLTQNLLAKKQTLESKNEDDIMMRLKNQAKLLQYRDNGNSSNSLKDRRGGTPPLPPSDAKSTSKKDIKLSLVPGYEDDSDAEDEGNSSSRKPVKPLFPISESTSTKENHGEKISKKFETSVGNIRVYDYRATDSTTSDSKPETDVTEGQSVVEEKPEESRELETKANKFLENIDAPSKAFQRKRRIAFDVAPSKSKEQESSSNKDDSARSNSPIQVSSTDPSERRGLGFAKAETSETDANKPESETIKKPGAIAFVKSTEESTSSSATSASNTPNTETKPRELSEEEKAEVKQLTEPIMEKLRFLSEGSPAASAVQVMAIQIQTLLSAWEAGVLHETYLRNWLVGTASELTRLEQTAAPPGWECQWDRSHKRYYYRNASSGEAQWTYPQTDIAGGTEEMELCTTPPPPEQEESPIIEMSAQAATISSTKEQQQQDTKQQEADPAPPPPPPKISSPSPPPPPRIYAEDIRRNKKRKTSPESSEISKTAEPEEETKELGPEPLPPGVDPPELAYTLPASALDAGVLYGTQQTNPIYAATLAGAAAAAGIPLLSHHPHHHHPAALMQSQLVHYNSAYHQHLHNALVAARLSGQEAVQFMVAAEYARVYENNQVIAKPPVKVTQESSLGSALNSFYSDIASMEKSDAVAAVNAAAAVAASDKERLEARPAVSSPAPPPHAPQVGQNEIDQAILDARERKKKKIKTGIGKKQKEMSSMVAKWQRAQKNYKD